MDFSKLNAVWTAPKPVDPVKVFQSLPSLQHTPNDLWSGQDQALKEWHNKRDSSDVLISLNTGAGKTIVGLLVAQSLVNEGIENVIFVCSTIDLVLQTEKEAQKIGLECTTRTRRNFSNDLFESGKSFCITTYSALFNGLSVIRRRHFPGAVIFDDAHVAETLLRDAFTLRIEDGKYPDLFQEISALFEPHFRELGIPLRFSDSLSTEQTTAAFISPGGLYEKNSRLIEILNRHGVSNNDDMKYSFSWLKDHFHACAGIFMRGAFELAPPFLPSRAIDIFERPIRRIYLSATLESQVDFIRAFGRKPKEFVRPQNDAGNGERLILDVRGIKGGVAAEFIKKFSTSRKVLIAVPTYRSAKEWEDVAVPSERDRFSHQLNTFRKNNHGAFMLVSRVDGIDLPHDTCRIMVIDGVPSGMSLLERYQSEFLNMKNVHAVRVANRLAQLLGRINRGRNDYGAFMMVGKNINKWIANDRNLALLPKLIQKQILVGREIIGSDQVTNQDQLTELVDTVLSRDPNWLNHYQSRINLQEIDKEQMARATDAEPSLEGAAIAEAKYAAAVWNRDFQAARHAIESTIHKTTIGDTPLGGWHSLWLGAAYELEKDHQSAYREYANAKKRLGTSITLPLHKPQPNIGDAPIALNEFGKKLIDLLSHEPRSKFDTMLAALKSEMGWIDSGAPHQAEVGVRTLGELLGFSASRPDSDQGTGPDVIWQDEQKRLMIGFELKTNKQDSATYTKKDIGQGHNHLEWIAKNCEDYTLLGLLFVGPLGEVTQESSPSDQMGLCLTKTVGTLRDQLVALIEDLKIQIPLERLVAVQKATGEYQWQIESLFENLRNCKFT